MKWMKVDPDTIRKLREERAWSQEHLAALTGLSLRTVQRVESEANASAETRMALATAFEVDLQQLQPSRPVASAAAAVPEDADPRPKLSYLHYRLLRFTVIVGLLMGFDVYQTRSVTW